MGSQVSEMEEVPNFDVQHATELKFFWGEICSDLSNHLDQRMIS